MTEKIPATVIILTFDEAVNVAACIESLHDFAEIIVVDSGSTDGTLEIVRGRYPRVPVLQHAFQDFGQQRNWALDNSNASQEWILFFDADERCTARFATAVRQALAQPEGHIGFYLCYRNMFLGQWLRRCTMFPTWQLRLLRAGRVRYRKEGHGQREEMDGTAGYITEPYDHFGFSKGVKQWIARHNEYSSNEVELILSLANQSLEIWGLISRDPVRRRRTLKRVAAHVPLRPFCRFVHLYFIRRGFLDGRPGFHFCSLLFAHNVHIMVKQFEARASSQLIDRRNVAAGSAATPVGVSVRPGAGATMR